MNGRVALSVAAAIVVSTATACARGTERPDAERFPEFTNYVVDAAGVVPDETEQRTNQELKAYEDTAGVQIAVAMIETTGDQSLEDYTIDLAKHWDIGQAEEDNGVLLLIAIEDRRLRIEVGEGIEGELTDLESGRITRNELPPLLREGDYGEAVVVGTREIRRAIGGDTTVPAPAQPDDQRDRDGGSRGLPGGGLWGILPFLVLPFVFGRRRRRSPVFWGGGTVQRRPDRTGRRRVRGDGDDDDRHDNWLAAALLGGLLLGGGRRGGWEGGDSGFDLGGGGFGGGGGGDFGGGGASGDW